MIYLFEDPMSLDEQMALDYVSEERRKKASAMKSAKSRRLSLAAYLLLRQGLREEYGIKEAPTLMVADGGKPYLRDWPYIHFNLSHCPKCVACAISREPIGIDVETIRPYKTDLASRVLSQDEIRKVASDPDPALSFTRFWTMKESLVKLSGTGLRVPIPDILARSTGPSPLFHSIITPDYVVTSCTFSQEEASLEVIRVKSLTDNI